MDKKLPKVFVNQIDKQINNNEKVFYSKEERSAKEVKGSNINEKISAIFASPKYVYKADVKIKLKDKTITKRIVGKNGNFLITIENELIPISDILDISYV